MHADVDDDAHGAHRLRPQHAELVRRIVEVAELAHEPLGVERPALGVPRRARERPLVSAQEVGEVAHLRDLQVMARDALVVADRHLAPEREARLAERRVPGAPGSARSPRTGRCSTSPPRRPAGRSSPRPACTGLGDVEVRAVELGDRGVEQLLVPRAGTRRRPRSSAVGSGSRCSITSSTSAPGTMRSATCCIACSMRCSSSQPHAYVSSRSSSMPLKSRAYSAVALASDRVVLGGVRRVLLDEVAARAPRTPRSRGSRARRGGGGTRRRRGRPRRTRRRG